MADRIETLKIYLLKCLMWWLVIAWAEMATVPGLRHSDELRGIWFTFCLIPMGAYTLSWTMPKRWVFIYGCGTSLSLMMRLHSMLTGWHYVSYSRFILAVWLIGLVFLLGIGCYIVSLFHQAIHYPQAKPHESGFSPHRLLLMSTFSFFFLLSSDIYLTGQRVFLENPFTWPQAVLTVPILTASAIALGYFILFVAGDRLVRNSCFTPSGVLLIGLATAVLYRWFAILSVVLTTWDFTFATSHDSFIALTTTGLFSAALVIGLHVCFRSTWRVPLTLIAASYAVAAFLGDIPHPVHQYISYGFTTAAVLTVLGYAYRYRNTSIMDRVGWVGVGCFVATSLDPIASLLFLVLESISA